MNSDFPNYYITARLVRDHSSTARIYEWIWFQRQKDHLEISQSLSAMPPLTPFSTLLLWPFASLAPMTAKHSWLLLSAALLLAIAWMLRRITYLPRSRIGLIMAVSYPLQRNFLNGQLYVALLFFLTLALWLHLRGRLFGAGTALAVAVGMKLFPGLFLLYLLRKRDWRTLAGVFTGLAGVVALSLAAFGWQLHRLYLLQILPRSIHGESTGPYNLTSSAFTVLFHRLFVFEPTLNPHPVVHAAWLFPVLLPIVQLMVIVPLVLLTGPQMRDPTRVRMEWAAVLLACLTLSPLPASYHFVLLFLPIAIMLERFSQRRDNMRFIATILLYLAVCFPLWPGRSGDGWMPLLHVPRLYAMIGLYVLALSQLADGQQRLRALAREKAWWVAGLTLLAAASVVSGLHSQRGVSSSYNDRLVISEEAVLLAQPLATVRGISFIAMQPTGYRALLNGDHPDAPPAHDELSHAAAGTRRWTEEVSATSRLTSAAADTAPIENAGSPVLSPDGHRLAFQRVDHGRAVLWLRSPDGAGPDVPATPANLDVLEASFAPDGGIVFSALKPGGLSALFSRGPAGAITELPLGEARYPAVSPDGKWLAYSGLTHGSWNLRLREIAIGTEQHLTDLPCNAIEPAWEEDSRTLLYASDCGRAIGQTALHRRRVVP